MQWADIGNYRILQMLNPERQSRTFKVVHKYTEEVCALKLVYTDDQSLIDALNKTYKRFSRGASRLRSVHIVDFKEYFVTEVEGKQAFALVSEFFAGQELDKYLDSPQADLTPQALLRIFTHTCEAVNECHHVKLYDEHGVETTGFPHGDITPWNILINDRHESRLLDFKIANQFTYSDEKLNSAKSRRVVPEQRKGNIISKKTDIFQLGYLLNFLFASDRNYDSWNLEKKSKNEIAAMLDPQKTGGKTKKLAGVIYGCTRDKPADRYTSIDALLAHLPAAGMKAHPTALLQKAGLALAGVLILLLAGWGIKSLLDSPSSPEEPLIASRGVTEIKSTKSAERVAFGDFHALLIGNNTYQHLPRLYRPQEDVQRLQQILLQQYGFVQENVLTVLDASRDDLFDALEQISKRVSSNDYLMVFYAGHGQLDGETGYWIPVEGQEDSRRYWISNEELKKFFDALPARNILLISDACFGGSILRDINTYQGGGHISDKKSRIALTSGSLESVPDESVFIDQVFWYLENNTDTLVYASDIYAGIRQAVVANTTTDPAYGPIRDAGHQGGDFFLRKKMRQAE